jgi:hypothetical protein
VPEKADLALCGEEHFAASCIPHLSFFFFSSFFFTKPLLTVFSHRQ